MAPAKVTKTVVWKGKSQRVNALAAVGLERLEERFEQYQSTRTRKAVYRYLMAVYGFAIRFKSSADCKQVAERMAKQKGFVVRRNQHEFSLLIRATSTVNEKTRWKWVRCLILAQIKGVESNKLRSFILDDHNGINECAEKWVA